MRDEPSECPDAARSQSERDTPGIPAVDRDPRQSEHIPVPLHATEAELVTNRTRVSRDALVYRAIGIRDRSTSLDAQPRGEDLARAPQLFQRSGIVQPGKTTVGGAV